MTYLKGMIHDITLAHGTEKAFYVDVDDGRWSSERNKHMWIPRKLCVIGEANECGWHDIMIPHWLFIKNKIDLGRLTDIIEKRLYTE